MGLEPASNDCACDVIVWEGQSYEIVFCPMHAAAPAMFEAIQDLLDSKSTMYGGHQVYHIHQNATVIENLKAALELATGDAEE
jgi:hypothetical protein